MVALLLDGKHLASHMKKELQHHVLQHIQKGLRAPRLAVLLLGDDPASCIYVKNKRQACQDVGIQVVFYHLPEDTSENELLAKLDALNVDEEIDGILVQLPLPHHIHTVTVLEGVVPHKDVDGLHPFNLGRLAQGHPGLRPCTPWGVMKLLEYYQIPLRGQHAVIVGSSNIVGRPMMLELLMAKATVTICHQATRDLESHVRQADLVIVATGKKDVVSSDWLSSHQVLVDVGIHRLPQGGIRGDLDFETCKQKVAWISPVPGGVGPMTICMLLHNVFLAYCTSHVIKRFNP